MNVMDEFSLVEHVKERVCFVGAFVSAPSLLSFTPRPAHAPRPARSARPERRAVRRPRAQVE